MEPLISVVLQDENEGVRRSAAKALGILRDVRAVGPLISVLKDKRDHGNVREIARESLQQIGKIGSAAVIPLLAFLQDENTYVRQVVANFGFHLQTAG